MSGVVPMHYDSTSPQHLKVLLRSTRTPSPPRHHRYASPTEGSTLKSARLVSAIQMGHTRCLRQYLFDLLDEYSNQKPSSPSANCSNIILDRREVPPRPEYEWVTARRQLFFDIQGSPYVIDFEQMSSPLIWAVDCREWSCLRLMCTIQAKEYENYGDEDSNNFLGAVYNPSQPQPVKRRIISSNSMKYAIPSFASQNCICCAPKGSPYRTGEHEIFEQEDIPNSMKERLRPLANVMLSVSFSNICSSANNCSISTGSILDNRLWKSAQSSPRRERSPANRSLHSTNAREANSVVLVGCINVSKHPSRHWKRPTPYRAYWIRGLYTYQSVLDYFFATGYEVVGTSCISQGAQEDCEHCRQDGDCSDYPNYPTGPLDPRNEIFHDHFSQLERILQSSGVSANRLDSVMVFNALAISAGRRLAGWCCHGAEGDPTIGLDPDEPLLEWRILSTLIDYGLNEFEWLEFLSPQQNFIGQALCVLAWPAHGWSHAETVSLINQHSKKPSRTFSGFVGSRSTGSRRYRRRSSSPLEKSRTPYQLPPAPFGAALRRQACLLLINLWSLGAFASHHIVTRKSVGNASTRTWDPRPGNQRSHSYTASMEGGDLRRIMLKSISFRSEQMQMVSIELIQSKI
ncbi:hypothetical protein Aperf_G00000119756 [Anoplocephala perfoliata]